MYDICPKCQHQRQANELSDPGICPACGIIFSKWLKSQLAAPETEKSTKYSDTNISSNLLSVLAAWLFPVEEQTNPFFFWGRVVVFIGLIAWGWKFIQMDFVNNPFEIGNSYMHNINLVFHEAGHVIFRPFGWFMTILGGSLFQIIMPLIVMFTFLIKNQNAFGASVGLWWAGQSLIDITPYIDDALEQKLVLLGGRTGADAPGNHDWNNILIEFNMLEKHREFATFTDTAGTLLMLLAFAWGGFILYKQYRNLS
jgi:hypothetical protein